MIPNQVIPLNLLLAISTMGNRNKRSSTRAHPPTYIEKETSDQHYAKIIRFEGGGHKNTQVLIDYTKGDKTIKTRNEVLPLAGRLRPGRAKQRCEVDKFCLVEGGRIIYIYNKKNPVKDFYLDHFKDLVERSNGYVFTDDIKKVFSSTEVDINVI